MTGKNEEYRVNVIFKFKELIFDYLTMKILYCHCLNILFESKITLGLRKKCPSNG